jgi:hypothetical protein
MAREDIAPSTRIKEENGIMDGGLKNEVLSTLHGKVLNSRSHDKEKRRTYTPTAPAECPTGITLCSSGSKFPKRPDL